MMTAAIVEGGRILIEIGVKNSGSDIESANISWRQT